MSRQGPIGCGFGGAPPAAGWGWRGGPPGPPWRRRERRAGPLRRHADDRLVGGVAAGVAAKTGFDVTLVRVVFVVAALASGFGVAAYLLAWLLLPADGEPRAIASAAIGDRRGLSLAVALTTVLVLVMLAVSALGATWLTSFGWAQVVSLAVLVLLWRNAPPQEQQTMRRLAEPLIQVVHDGGRSRLRLRLLAAAVLFAGGLAALVSGRATSAALRPLAGLVLVLAAAVVLLAPWWLRVARELVLERQARARAEERAELAARVHDSVLQTLALIQRRADSPQQVVSLARAQERELRSWLFDGRPPGSATGDSTTVAAGVRAIQEEVEAQHGITVEAVTVGDCPLDEHLAAALAAAREATVNAAKWSGAPVVSLFTEVTPDEVAVFVRDRGRGFDPAAVAADRKGLAESITARMARHGGTAAVRSAPGEGTEVSLHLPRTATERQASRA